MPLPDLPFYRQSKPMSVIHLPTQFSAQVNGGYFRLRFVDMRLARDWVATKILAPALHCTFDFPQSLGGTHEVVVGATVPPDSKQHGDLRRTYIASQTLTPILPYNGIKINARLGLFAVPAKDLAGEMLDLLSVLAGTTQRPDLIAALGLTSMLNQGINALLGLNESVLLLSWQGEIGDLEELRQEYLVVTPPGSNVEINKLTITNDRLYMEGNPVDHIDYMVFAIEVCRGRRDWRTLPEIKPYIEAWNNARSIYNLPSEDYNQSVTKLLIALRTSPHVVPIDAERIVKSEIIPLMQAGTQIQESLFRAAGFDVEALKKRELESDKSMNDFVRLDANGADAGK